MYRKRPEGWLKHFDFIMIDLLAFLSSNIIAYFVWHSGNFLRDRVYLITSLVMILTSFVISIVFETHKGVFKRGMYLEFVSILKHGVVVIISVITYLYFINITGYSRMTIGLTGIIYLVVGFMARILWKSYLQKKGRQLLGNNSLIIVTTKDLVKIVGENIKSHKYFGYTVVGIAVIDDDMVGVEIESVPVIANKDTIVEYVCRNWVDELFINIPSTNVIAEEWIKTFSQMGVTVHFRLLHKSDMNKNQFLEHLGEYTVLTTSIGVVRFREVVFKRIMDIMGGLIGSIIAAFVCVIIGPLIFIKSPGPIFFKQTRVGKNGKNFTVYKFRSMYLDAEERKKELQEQNRIKNGMMFKVDWDTRIIGSEKGPDKGIGNFIRKYSLDEWPQFFNILKGDMSLVGTRPPTRDEWEKYENHHRARLATKPGLTGMWQVSGRSSIVDFEEVVKLDLEYITHWNLGLDVKILFKTVWVVIRRDGAM